MVNAAEDSNTMIAVETQTSQVLNFLKQPYLSFAVAWGAQVDTAAIDADRPMISIPARVDGEDEIACLPVRAKVVYARIGPAGEMPPGMRRADLQAEGRRHVSEAEVVHPRRPPSGASIISGTVQLQISKVGIECVKDPRRRGWWSSG